MAKAYGWTPRQILNLTDEMRDTLIDCLRLEKSEPDPVSNESAWFIEAMKEVRDGYRQA